MVPDVTRHIAALARLELSEDELGRLSRELPSMAAFADKLAELDFDGVLPTSHVVPLKNALRDDAALPSPKRDIMLSNAKELDGGFVAVPRAVE